MKKVFICGAHSVGKTTLCQYLCDHLEIDSTTIHMSSEIARLIIKENPNLPVTQHCTSSFKRFNLLILDKQYERNMELAEIADSDHQECLFVCDRGPLDPVTYLEMFVSPDVAEKVASQDKTLEMIEELQKSDDVIVVVIRPCRHFVERDHVRIDTSFEELEKYDRIMRRLMDSRKINFLFLEEKDLRSRALLIVKRMKIAWPSLRMRLNEEESADVLESI